MSRSGRGFEDEARQRVLDAARRSGLSVGELVQALQDGPRRGRAAEPVGAGIGALDRRLDALGERMRRPAADRTASRLDRTSAEAQLDEIAASVGRLSGATRSRGARRDAEAGHILDTLEAIDRRVRDLSDDRPRGRAAFDDDLDDLRAAPRGRAALDLDAPRPRRDESALVVSEIRALRAFLESRAGEGADVSGEIRRLAGKIDRLAEARPDREEVESLATELGRLRDVVLQSNVEGSLKSLEAGYGQIVDRLEGLERGLGTPRDGADISEIRSLLSAVPQADHLTALERNLDRLTDKFERLAARDENPYAQQIERRLTDLRAQIESFDPGKVVVSLDQRLKAVTDKLDALERSTKVPASGDRVVKMLEELRTLAAGNRAADELRAIESRIADLGERIAEFEKRRPSFEDTDRIHDRIAELAGRLERIPDPDEGRRTVRALEAAVARLDAAIADAARPADTGKLDARLDQIIDRLDKRPPASASATADVENLTREIAAMRSELAAPRSNDDLEAQMRLLAERLDRSTAHEGDDEALAQIEEQLGQISRQIEATQSRVPDLSSIENHIVALADRIETTHVDSVVAAREAAREMVRELAETRGDGMPSAALDALKGDLRALKDAARETEDRTNGTLVSLHDALTGIVGRLAAIEKIAQGSARNAAAQRGGAAPEPAPRAAAPEPVSAPVAQATQRAAHQAAAQAQPVRMPAAPSAAEPAVAEEEVRPAAARPASNPIARAREMLAAGAGAAAGADDNRPLEPGSGKPTPRPLMPAEARAQANPDEPNPATARKAEFIAAARRAAQVAASTAAAAPTVSPDDRTPTPEPSSEGGALSRIGRVLKTRRRPLVLATAALVLAILTLQVMPGRKPAPEQTADARTRIEQTAPEAHSTVAQRDAASADGSLLSKAPAAETAQGFSMPLATDGSAKPPAEADRTPASQRTSALQGVPLAGEPVTTGSIPSSAATSAVPTEEPPRPVVADADLPEQIGPETLRRAATSGDARAAFEVALRFAEGKSVAADLARAVTWYTVAAEKGLATAQYRLAVAYEKGLGVTRDAEKARAWYTAAAEQGNVRSMHNLGVLYANSRDMAKAVPWFQKAADYGLRDSQFNLGIIHALGSGVKQDLAVSYKWFALAARQGDAEAEKKQNEVAAHLDKVNLAAGRMAVQTWVQRSIDRTANEETRGWTEPASAAAPSAPATQADMIRQAQHLLKTLGFYNGAVDGNPGPGTKTAIRTYQKKTGLPQTGEADAALIKALSGRQL